jgi:phosphatidylserine/phosphatidylglycerophosphate/cardiolipin synthase-like enzyme
MSSIRESTATRLKVLANREEEWNLRMEMVNSAQRFLVLTTYYFGNDERGGKMADALLAAARRGVRVVLVLDRFGQRLAQNLSRPSQRPWLQERLREIAEAGGLVVHYSPQSLRHRLVGGGVHVKIQVSEGGVAVFGSSNIAHHSFAQWNEVSLELEGDVVAHLLREACRFARLSDDEAVALAGFLPVPRVSAATRRLRYVREDPAGRSGRFFPFGTVHNRLTDELVNLMDSARRSLCIASLYCKPAPALKAALLRACRRGVDVEIFHSHRDSLGVTQFPWIAASIQYGSVLKAGARIYENRAGEHSKMLLVDDREVAVGSYNLEHAAHDRLIEAMIFSDDVETCEHFRALFETMRRNPGNAALTPVWLSELPLQLQVKRWLCRPLQRWI